MKQFLSVVACILLLFGILCMPAFAISPAPNLLSTSYEGYGELQFSTPTYSVSEAGSTATITVSRINGSSGVVGVTYATKDSTAKAEADYTTTIGTLSFADGVLSKSFTIPILDDTSVESSETATLTLTAPTGGAILGTSSQATLIIADNDNAVAQYTELQFSAAAYSIFEAEPTVSIAVSRINGSSGVVGVTYATKDSTAKAGSDYTATTGTLSFAEGELSKSLTIPITDDTSIEGSETVTLTLSAPTGDAILGTPSQAILTIVDNEVNITPSVFSASGLVTTSSSGNAIKGVTMTFSCVPGFGKVPSSVTTEADGSWRQSGFHTGITYRVTPSRSGYTFTPAYLELNWPNTTLDFRGTNSTPTAGFNIWPLKTTTDTKKVWTLKFSRPVDSSPLNSSCIYVTDDSFQPVNTILIPSSDGVYVQVSPVNAYTVGKTYWLFITSGLNNSITTQNLAKPVAMPFKINTSE